MFPTAAMLLMSVAYGCAPQSPPPPPSPALDAAARAIEANQGDAAVADADSYLRTDTAGAQTAYALYLRGRGCEQRVAHGESEAARNLADARRAYVQALAEHPDQPLEADIRASLSNAAFYQDDFPAAIEQATAALGQLSDAQAQARVLLCIGRSQQRLGRFRDADQTFRQVRQRYNGFAEAVAAAELENRHEFYVQLATYSSREPADKAMSALASQGLVVVERTDRFGRSIVNLGPYQSYGAAKQVRDRYVSDFPNALVVP